MILSKETALYDQDAIKNKFANTDRSIAEAKTIAQNTEQHYWFVSDATGLPEGVGTGAHITELTKEEFLRRVAIDRTDGGGNTLARSNGFVIRNGLVDLAQFSADGIIIGNQDSMRTEITTSGFNLKDVHGVSWFNIEDQRDADGTVTLTDTISFSMDQEVEDITVNHPIFSVISLTLLRMSSGNEVIPADQYHYTKGSYIIEILGESGTGIDVSEGDTMTVTYKYEADYHRSYTFGNRRTDTGYSSVGKSSYVLGYNCAADQDYSTAIGEGVITDRTNQVAIGKFNKINIIGRRYEFVIGNGSDDTHRSNLFGIDSDGYVDHNSDIVSAIDSDIINTSVGQFVSGQYARWGNVVQMQITFRNTASTPSGEDILDCNFDPQTPGAILPIISARGCGYYGAHALIGHITTAGHVTVRNASSSALTIGSNNSTTVTFTYICDPHR